MKLRAKDSGFSDGDSGAAEFILRRVSYQHLSEYFPLFESEECSCSKSFKNLNRIMVLDRKFQSILMEYIGLFEMQMRSRYSNEMSLRYGAFAHRNRKLFKNGDYFNSFIREYSKLVSRCNQRNGSRQKRDIERYGDMPIWEAVEEMPIGMVSRLFSNTKSPKVKDAVAESFGEDREHLESWLGTLTFSRNRCAHFGQFLGTRLPVMPKKMSFVDADNSQPFYVALLIMRLMRTNWHYGDLSLLPSVTMAMEINHLFNSFKTLLPCAGVPAEWSELIANPDVSGIGISINYGPPQSEEDSIPYDARTTKLKLKRT